jgi:hypothetical protein
MKKLMAFMGTMLMIGLLSNCSSPTGVNGGGSGGGGSGNQTVTYTGVSGGEVYTLTITKAAARAYTPQSGDSYTLTAKESSRRARKDAEGLSRITNQSSLFCQFPLRSPRLRVMNFSDKCKTSAIVPRAGNEPYQERTENYPWMAKIDPAKENGLIKISAQEAVNQVLGTL